MSEAISGHMISKSHDVSLFTWSLLLRKRTGFHTLTVNYDKHQAITYQTLDARKANICYFMAQELLKSINY